MPCSLCGIKLLEGETIHAVSFPASQGKIMHIYGCPFCRKPGGRKRICPVCKKEIPLNGFAVGRMWQKKDKLHLHLTGCTVCKPKYLTKKG